MSDLTLESARWCQTNEFYGDVVRGYVVTYGASNPGPHQCNWHCTCKGFQFRKTCKHIEEAKADRCGYGWEAAAGSPIEMGMTCPKCGGPTSTVRYAT